MAALHGVGVTHHLEDRVVGLKVRGVYESPAAHAIIRAHETLEKFVCTRQENEFKVMIDQKWGYLCYGALWHEPLMDDLMKCWDLTDSVKKGLDEMLKSYFDSQSKGG